MLALTLSWFSSAEYSLEHYARNMLLIAKATGLSGLDFHQAIGEPRRPYWDGNTRYRCCRCLGVIAGKIRCQYLVKSPPIRHPFRIIRVNNY